MTDRYILDGSHARGYGCAGEGKAVSTAIQLTIREIRDLAEFAGLVVMDIDEDSVDLDTELTLCSDVVLVDDGTSDERRYRWAAYLTDYPTEGMMGLGEEKP